MKKLTAFLLIANLFPSGTILELIKPYPLLEKNPANQAIVFASLLVLCGIKTTIIKNLKPQTKESLKSNKVKLKLISQAFFKELFSPI
jgi:hypothetical protein